ICREKAFLLRVKNSLPTPFQIRLQGYRQGPLLPEILNLFLAGRLLAALRSGLASTTLLPRTKRPSNVVLWMQDRARHGRRASTRGARTWAARSCATCGT